MYSTIISIALAFFVSVPNALAQNTTTSGEATSIVDPCLIDATSPGCPGAPAPVVSVPATSTGSGGGSGSSCTNSDGATGLCLSGSECSGRGGMPISVTVCTGNLVCCQGAGAGGTGTTGTTLPVPVSSGGGTAGSGGGSGTGATGATGGSVRPGVAPVTGTTGSIVPRNIGALPNTPITTLIQNLLMWLLYIFGFVAIIAFVIAGFQYITSMGDDAQIKTAKSTMKYAALGVLVALSSLIVITAIERVLRGAWFF